MQHIWREGILIYDDSGLNMCNSITVMDFEYSSIFITVKVSGTKLLSID